MKWLPFLILLLIPLPLSAGQNLSSDLVPLLNNHQVLLLGEKHKKPESTNLLTDLKKGVKSKAPVKAGKE